MIRQIATFSFAGFLAFAPICFAAQSAAKPHAGVRSTNTAGQSSNTNKTSGSTAAGAAQSAAIRSGAFTISQHGHAVGTADFRLTPNANGYDSASTVNVAMQGLNYALSKTERLDQIRHIQHEQLSATVNGSAINLTGKPDGDQFLLNISANGRSTTSRLDGHATAIFLPDFDPGALQLLVTAAIVQNNRDLWAVVPKQSGSVAAVQIATYPDEHGTLDGQPVTVHHLIATISGIDTDLFVGPENQVVQAELPQNGFALVRKGFVLTPPKKPIAPAAPAAK